MATACYVIAENGRIDGYSQKVQDGRFPSRWKEGSTPNMFRIVAIKSKKDLKEDFV